MKLSNISLAVAALMVTTSAFAEADLNGLEIRVTDLKDNTELLNDHVDYLNIGFQEEKAKTATNIDNITANKQDIAANKQDIAANKQDIAVNKQDIAVNKQDIAVNKQDIAANKQDIAANKQDIAVNKQDIAANKQDIAANKQDIAANKQDIAVNKQDIAVNKQDIKDTKSDLNTYKADTNQRLGKIDSDVSALNNRVKNVDNALKRGLAAQSALNGLFQPYSVGKFNASMALGGYDSKTAIAVGSGYRFNENFAAKSGLAFNTENAEGVSYNVGFNYEW